MKYWDIKTGQPCRYDTTVIVLCFGSAIGGKCRKFLVRKLPPKNMMHFYTKLTHEDKYVHFLDLIT